MTLSDAPPGAQDMAAAWDDLELDPSRSWEDGRIHTDTHRLIKDDLWWWVRDGWSFHLDYDPQSDTLNAFACRRQSDGVYVGLGATAASDDAPVALQERATLGPRICRSAAAKIHPTLIQTLQDHDE